MYVLYNTGDSFHKETNVIYLIGVYASVLDAIKVKDAIEKDYENDPSGKKILPGPKAHYINVELPILEITEEIYTGVWKGYFESLRSVKIETILPVK